MSGATNRGDAGGARGAARRFAYAVSRAIRSAADILRRMSKSPAAMISLSIVGIWLLLAILGPAVAPYRATEQIIAERFQPPSLDHLFGTDRFGRDVFSRVIVGSRSVFILAASSTALATVLGTLIGLLTGYFGGLFDQLAMRFMDILMSFPALLLAMLLLGVSRPSALGVIIVIGIVFAPRIARVARSSVLGIRTEEFVEAARVRGEGAAYIMFSEILPNILGPLGVEAAVRFGYAIFLSASLGFLGLGVQPPTPDWGLLMNEAQEYITRAPWMAIFPALAIASLTVSMNFLSDTIRKLEAGDL